jgi:small subunit ribosomal protein S16
MLKIKLLLKGKKHQPTYRIVVAEAKTKANGKFVDEIGFYTPQTKTLDIDQKKLENWQKSGAQLTLGVNRLINPDKFPKKVNKKKIEAAKAKKEAVEVTPDTQS